MSLNLPPFPSYSDSGVVACRQRPTHWGSTRLKFLATLNSSKSEVANVPDDTLITFLPMEAVGENGELDVSRTRPIGQIRNGYTYLREGDVCIAKITPCFENGKGAIVRGTLTGIAFGTTELIPFRCHESSDAGFLYYLLKSPPFKVDAEASMYGAGGQQRVGDSFAANYEILLPPPEERAQIARFLDYETARIDALIEKQQQLIALLKEKRQAVISHAVTKGLNPNAPLRDSGVEWLGMVPAHWTVKKLRYFATILRGKFTHRPRNDPAFYDGRFPFVQTGDITGASKYITAYKQTLNDRGTSVSREFPRGTLVMAIAANIGDVAILDFPAYFPDSVVGLLPNTTSDVMFLYYMMQAMKQPMVQRATISTQMNLNVDQIAWLTSACPPIEEQQRIAMHLDRLLSRISILEDRMMAKIALLQERRTALISAAVTGKIDVRNWTPPESKPERDVA